jgi:hypothetical protein
MVSKTIRLGSKDEATSPAIRISHLLTIMQCCDLAHIDFSDTLTSRSQQLKSQTRKLSRKFKNRGSSEVRMDIRAAR